MKKRISKLLSVAVCVLMLAMMLFAAFTVNAALPGEGSEDDPIGISDAAGLAELAADPAAFDGKYIVLDADITVPAGFTPIGTADAPFKGFFNGGGHTITGTGYLVNNTSQNYVGLFGYTEGAVIADFTVETVKISCADYAGIVVGYAAAGTVVRDVKIESCSLEADNEAGGVVGHLAGGSVENCKVKATPVKGYVSSVGGIGGIVGSADESQILCCINEGSSVKINNKTAVNGQKNCGGIVGLLTGSVSHCITTGAVESAETNLGDENSACVGGIAGYASGTISYCGAACTVTAKQDCGGFVGCGDNVTISDCYFAGAISRGWDRDTSEDEVTFTNCVQPDDTHTAEDMKSEDAYEGWEFGEIWLEPAEYHGYAYPVLADCSFHTMAETVTRPVSCEDAEKVKCYCSDPSCTFDYAKETTPAQGHIWDEGTVTLKATCVEQGEMTFTCTREGCGKTEVRKIPVDPDAHTDLDEDGICDDCENEIKQQEEVKKSFFQKVIDFFKGIFEWIRNLFVKK